MKQGMDKKSIRLMVFAAALCIAMILIESWMQPAYAVKSAFKLLLFVGGVILYGNVYKESIVFQGLRPKRLKLSLFLAVGVYIVILAAYFVGGDLIDGEQIRVSLLEKEKVDAGNFIFVAAYISIVNSFIEELFFRGFLFLTLYRKGLKKIAYLFSAAAFSLYHIGIISGWFSWYMYLLTILALFAAGVILDKLCQYGDSYTASWAVHIAANLGINTIGFMIL